MKSRVLSLPRPVVRAIGMLFVLHALAHTLPGMRVTDPTPAASAGWGAPLWLATLVWAVATTGLLAAGFGLLGVRTFRKYWRAAAVTGATASLFFILAWWGTGWSVPAVVFDLLALAVALRLERVDQPTSATAGRLRRSLRATRDVVATGFVAYLALAIVLRPWHMRWGSTDEELRQALPGDEFTPAPNFQIQHAVTIAAPPEQVWPWLAQIGHDRGGFYSYTWLENSLGLHVRNADRIHPEWQALAAGDSVIATPDDYLGLGRRFGWRVARAEPNRVLFLETWGAFVLEPNASSGTRLIVRSRGNGATGISSLALAPAGLLLGEPAHFIMERRMLLGIKSRVESRPVEPFATPASTAAPPDVRGEHSPTNLSEGARHPRGVVARNLGVGTRRVRP